MTDPYLNLRIFALIAIAFVYLIYDIFNKRNVPSSYAYTTFAIGIAFTLLYMNLQLIEESILLTLAIGALGYVLYRVGQIGAADVFEFVAISLIIPIQPVPYLATLFQFNLPFIVSVFIATGIIALLMIPAYYLPRARRILKKNLMSMVTRKDELKGLLVLCAYGVFMTFIIYTFGANLAGIAIIAIVMVSASLTVVFERPITDSMVSFIPVKEFEEGDIIATNLMKRGEISQMKKKVRGFDRLVTISIMKRMQKAGIKKKFPVYRSAMPLALPIFIGLILSILFGNVLLFIVSGI